MGRNQFLVLLMLLLLPVSAIQAQQARRVRVPITRAAGENLRKSPSMKAPILNALRAGDEVEVIRTAESIEGDGTLWALVKIYHSINNDPSSPQQGWVLDKDLGYPNRFTKITSWKKQRVSGELGDYWFDMDINRDGSFTHRAHLCIDCGETDCNKGEKKIGSECISRGHLYRYNNFVWAKKPTKFQEYFLIDRHGNLHSVYPK